jgi:hypothetical protein
VIEGVSGPTNSPHGYCGFPLMPVPSDDSYTKPPVVPPALIAEMSPDSGLPSVQPEPDPVHSTTLYMLSSFGFSGSHVNCVPAASPPSLIPHAWLASASSWTYSAGQVVPSSDVPVGSSGSAVATPPAQTTAWFGIPEICS